MVKLWIIINNLIFPKKLLIIFIINKETEAPLLYVLIFNMILIKKIGFGITKYLCCKIGDGAGAEKKFRY